MLKWRNVIAVVLALMLALGAASFAEEAGEAGAPASGANAYLMFANADWSV